MRAEFVHVARHDVRVALGRHLVGVRLAGRGRLLAVVERGELVILPEVAQVHPLRLERLQHVHIPPVGEFRGPVVVDRQSRLLLRGQAVTAHGNDGIPVGLHHLHLRDARVGRRFDRRVARENHVVFVDDDRAGGPDVAERVRNRAHVAR
jgi:hypothetical protein